MSDPVILAAGLVEDFTPPGSTASFRIAAPTFGQAGRLVQFLADTLRPSSAIFNEAMREAVRDLYPGQAAALVALVDAFEEADDELQATYAAFGRDDRAAIKGATLSMLRAERGRARVEAMAWDHPKLVALRRTKAEADRAETALLAREALRGWSGDTLPPFEVDADGLVKPDLLAQVPAHDVLALAKRVGEMTRPSKAAEKN